MTKGDSKTVYYTKKSVTQHGGAGGVWFGGFIGALIYFLHFHSGSLWLVLVAFFKAIFWLPYLVFYLLRFMGI